VRAYVDQVKLREDADRPTTSGVDGLYEHEESEALRLRPECLW
jgi:hypothetical protein